MSVKQTSICGNAIESSAIVVAQMSDWLTQAESVYTYDQACAHGQPYSYGLELVRDKAR